MASEVLELAILLSLKDLASGALSGVQAQLQAVGEEGSAAGEQLEKLRENLNQGLVIGGIGLAGLASLKKGVESAATLEDAVLDLRQAYEENAAASTKSRQQQETDIGKIMSLATELGSQLQGGTQDYVSMFTAMNKAGIEAEETLSGAGKAAAYLANVNGAIREGTAPQLAQDLGSFGKMFDLKGNDWMQVVELFSALEDRFDIGSSSLIESSKYFFSTAKGVMNLRGLQGAEDTAKLFAFSKRYAGREGSEAGTSLEAIITSFISHRKAVESLAKDKGIKLEFFDAKGDFQGVENMFAQFEKLRKLSPEERGLRLQNIFGEQGARVANAMVEQGVEGWKKITEEANKSVAVNDKINAQMNTYNAKVEALGGSWENFKATAFTPLMEDTKKYLDYANKIVNSLQKRSAENPKLMGILGTIAANGSTAMVVLGGFKMASSAIKMFQLASVIAGGGVPPAGGGVPPAAATGFRGFLQGSLVKTVGQLGAIMVILYSLQKIVEGIEVGLNAGEVNEKVVEGAKKQQELFKSNEKELLESGKSLTPNDLEFETNSLWATALGAGLKKTFRDTQSKLPLFSMPFTGKESFASNVMADTFAYPITWATGAQNPFGNYAGPSNRDNYAEGFKKTTPGLADPRLMEQFLRQLGTRVPDPKERREVEAGLDKAFPESFATAMQELSKTAATITQTYIDDGASQKQNAEVLNQQNQSLQNFSQGLTGLQQPITQSQENLFNLGDTSGKAVSPIQKLGTSANSVSFSLDSVSNKIANWQPPIPQIQSYPYPAPGGSNPYPAPSGSNPKVLSFPGHSVGGIIERDGLAMVHAGNVITPAKSKKYQGSSDGLTINYSPNITIGGASESDKRDFQAMLYQHAKDIDRIVAQRMGNGRARA